MKIKLTKDPSRKGYYLDEKGNLYVFRFGGRPIKVDGYRDDKPKENKTEKEVEVNSDRIVDGTKAAQQKYKFMGTESAIEEYSTKQNISYSQAEELLNVNGDDYNKEWTVTGEINKLESKRKVAEEYKKSAKELNYKDQYNEYSEEESILRDNINSLKENEEVINSLQKEAHKKGYTDWYDDNGNPVVPVQKNINGEYTYSAKDKDGHYVEVGKNAEGYYTDKLETGEAREYHNSTSKTSPENDARIFKQISDFYGYNKLSDKELRETLDFAEQRGMYHSKSDIAAMRRHLDRNKSSITEKINASDKAVDDYQKAKANYDNTYKKYDDVRYGTPEWETAKAEKDKAFEAYKAARDTAITKFSETIPYKDMLKQGADIAGVRTEFTEPILEVRNGKGYVKYQSEDIRNQCGPFGQILQECRLTQFNSSITFDEKTGEPYYWGSMDLSYQHNEGGSNGMKVMDYVYSQSKGWEITDSKGNFYKNGRQLKTVSELAEWYADHGYSTEAALEIANKKVAERKN